MIHETPMTEAPRYHALDATRSAAMMLGLFFHGALSFMETPFGWAIQDVSTHLSVDVLCWISHTFRMPVFFLLSGFFARMLCERRGARGLLAHRAKRILVPFLVFLVPVVVSLAFLWEWGSEVMPRAEPGLPDRALAPPEPGLTELPLLSGHLWFLYYLILIYLLLSPVLLGVRSLPAGNRGDRLFTRIASSALLPFLMAVPTAGALAFMPGLEVETPVTLIPEPQILGFYLIFFVFGWALHRDPAILESFARRPWLNLGLGIFFLIPLIVLADQSLREPGLTPALRCIALYLSGLETWLLGLVFIGFFCRYLSRPRPWVRWLSDASYWSYILHLPVVVFFQVWVATWAWPGIVKYGIVMAGTIGVCLVTYQFLVRYTFVGAMLNGRKTRPGTVAT